MSLRLLYGLSLPGLQLLPDPKADLLLREQKLLYLRFGVLLGPLLLRPALPPLHELLHLDLLPDHRLRSRGRSLFIHRHVLYSQGDRCVGRVGQV